MKVTKEYLKNVNPTCCGEPLNFVYEAEVIKMQQLANSLRELGFEIRISSGIQDANFHADLGIGSYGAVRLSLFDSLVTITREERFPPDLLNQVIGKIEENDYVHVPWHFFGESFETRERVNGDLFNQLFDYQ